MFNPFTLKNRNDQLLATIQERNAELEDVDLMVGNAKGDHENRLNCIAAMKINANTPKQPVTQHDVDQLRLALNPFAKWMD